jgi:hypothetical protein
MPDLLGTAEERDRAEGDPEAEAVMGMLFECLLILVSVAYFHRNLLSPWGSIS